MLQAIVTFYGKNCIFIYIYFLLFLHPSVPTDLWTDKKNKFSEYLFHHTEYLEICKEISKVTQKEFARSDNYMVKIEAEIFLKKYQSLFFSKN